MIRGPLSEVAHKAISRTVNRSIQNGTDVWEELNKVGLLATEPRKQEIEAAALKNLFDRFAAMSEDDFLANIRWHQTNSNPATPADLLRAITTWLRTYISYIERD